MNATVAESLLTVEDLLALPEDGVERELIRGELRERPMTRRNRWHANTVEQIAEKVDEYLSCGVPLVWLIDPHFRTITVHRPDTPPELFNAGQTISADPHLPGFHAAVREVFE